MSKAVYDKIIHLMKCGALQGIDTGRLDGKCEDVIPLEDAIAIVDLVNAESDVIDKIREEVLEYIDDLDIAYEICGVFDKYREKVRL